MKKQQKIEIVCFAENGKDWIKVIGTPYQPEYVWHIKTLPSVRYNSNEKSWSCEAKYADEVEAIVREYFPNNPIKIQKYKGEKICLVDIARGAYLSECNMGKCRLNWCEWDCSMFPFVVTRQGGKGCKAKFHKKEFERIAKRLFELNGIDKSIKEISEGELYSAMLYSLNHIKGSVTFLLYDRGHYNGVYQMFPYFDEGNGEFFSDTIWIITEDKKEKE